jgi:hypothetical protein
MMRLLSGRLALAIAVLTIIAGAITLPDAFWAARLLAAQNDPVELAAVGVERRLTPELAAREIEQALAGGDTELAQSFVDLADERSVAIDENLRARVAADTAKAGSALGIATRFAKGFVTGEPEDGVALAGMLAGDLFVFGDIRDVTREGINAAQGEEVDTLVLALAGAGIAITAGTYATVGLGAPGRLGLSVFKAALRGGRMTPRMLRAVRDTIKVRKARGVLRLAGDVERVQAKAGTRAALDGLRLAESPTDMTRLARLAAAKGGKTRAVLKLLGRGAIALTTAAWELASWLLWGVLLVLSFCANVKRLTERTTLRFIRFRKLRRARLAAA